MLITSESKSRTKYKKRCVVLKQQQQQQQQVNSAKNMTKMHVHDTNYPITQPIDKHDTYTVPLGLVVTNHIREFYTFDYHYYYYYYYYYHH